ncbi:MAG TPA: peptidylprolyl isomerase [Candidatus Brocadiaceae bacterium]|nr:peptidylprolyl isomerase [Candidatus Brocadiaceae bacterium]
MKRYFIPLLSCLLVISFLRGALSAEKKHQNEEVLATVNGKKITQADLANRLETFRNTDAETLDTINKQEILDQLITDILLEEFIDRQGLVVASEEIEREVNQVRSNITGNQKDSGQSLEKVLASIGSNMSEFQRSIKHSLALEKYFDNKLDDKTLEKYFDGNKSLFNGESVKVSHILIDTRNMKTQEELSHALEQIKSIKKEIDQGAAFDEMAKKYSNCPSAQNGGDLGFIQRKGNLARLFSDAAFSLRRGQVSEPVQTEYGYHLIKVTEKKEGANVKFVDVKQKVRLAVLDEETVKLLSQLHKAAQIVINE